MGIPNRTGKGSSEKRERGAGGLRGLSARALSTSALFDDKPRPLTLGFAIFIAVALIFFLRLLYLQVIVAGDYQAMAEESRTINFETTPRRGTIYDRNGVVLATSVDATTIYCNPAEVTEPKYASIHLAKLLGGTSSDYMEKLTKESATFVYIKRQAHVEVAQQVKDLNLDGIYFIDDTRREYPNGAIGGQVIGVCDVDGNGITGLELQYDDILAGTPGKYSAERGEKGTPIPGGVHEDTPAVDGEDIMISLDIKLQDAVEQALAEGIAPYEAEEGTSVVMDSNTGEIYAICSVPYLDPENLADSLIGSDNLTTVTRAFEPGSCFKVISALAALETGKVDVDTQIFCPAQLEADEYVVTDSHKRNDATMTLTQIIADSSNVGISLATEKAGFDVLNDMIYTLKFGEPTGIDYPGEASGKVQNFDEWARITGYNVSFGQGITATPIQMVRAYSAIANGGYLVQPHFLLSKPQTGTWEEYEKEQVLFDEDVINKTESLMRAVVLSGTGKKAQISGYDVIGKTSTAEIAEDGTYAESRYNLCFAGYINNSNSGLVCFVSANDVRYEGNVVPVFHDIMAEAIEQYNIVPN